MVILTLLSHADILTLLIFCVLIGTSFACLVIFLMKIRLFKERLAQALQVRTLLHNASSLEDLAKIGISMQATHGGFIIAKVLASLRKIVKTNASITSSPHGLKSHEREQLTLVVKESLYDIGKAEEVYIPFFKLSAEEGTLIGLFGTVWGLINVFSRISERQTADIPTVAPGIAEALLVTLAGLCVTVPGLVYYAVCTQKLRHLEDELAAISERILSIVDSSLARITPHWETFNESSLAQNP